MRSPVNDSANGGPRASHDHQQLSDTLSIGVSPPFRGLQPAQASAETSRTDLRKGSTDSHPKTATTAPSVALDQQGDGLTEHVRNVAPMADPGAESKLDSSVWFSILLIVLEIWDRFCRQPPRCACNHQRQSHSCPECVRHSLQSVAISCS